MTTTHRAAEFGLTIETTRHISSFFRKCWSTSQQWFKRVRIRSALYGLQDRELKDIGIMRGEIDYVVSNGINAMEADGRYRGQKV